jgi:ABC-type multidrug transport system fused ATPase/permease subunit
MIVVAHREATVAHCDRVFRLVAGQLVEVNRE